MSLTSYRAAPSRVNHIKISFRLPKFHLAKRKGRFRGPKSPFGGPYDMKRESYVRLADLAATYSPAS